METRIRRITPHEHAYGMKKHNATRLHYDLRLEWNGVLLSWALPEEPNYNAGETHRVIEMDDHRRQYLSFEGVHETGTIMLWDRGTWEPHPEFDDIETSLRRGILRFTLHGEKLKGGWTLARTGIRENARLVWILSKYADAYAGYRRYPLEQWANSSSTGRDMKQILQQWNSPIRHQGQMKLFG